MKVNELQGILRSALMLAVGYLNLDEYSDMTYEKAKLIVADYLTENGLKFDYSLPQNQKVARVIVMNAERIAHDGTSIDTAIKTMQRRLKINLGY